MVTYLHYILLREGSLFLAILYNLLWVFKFCHQPNEESLDNVCPKCWVIPKCFMHLLTNLIHIHHYSYVTDEKIGA
jgi:hypothetical protein